MVKGSGKFVDGAARVFKVSRDKNGREVKSGGRAFSGEKFPMSRQMHRPVYSKNQNKWLTLMTDKELNELVPKCRLKYPKNHIKRDQYITETFAYDAADAFFNHYKLKVVSVEGEVALRSDNPIHEILLECFKASPDFQVGTGGARSMLRSRVKYVISDKVIETAAKKAELDLEDEAHSLFKALVYEDMKKIARALYIPIDDHIDPTDLELLMRDRIRQNQVLTSGQQRNLSFRDAFIAVCKLDKDNLNMRDLLHRAKKLSLIRKKADGYEFLGNYIGKRIDTVERYFLDPENQEMFFKLETAMKEAEKIKVG